MIVIFGVNILFISPIHALIQMYQVFHNVCTATIYVQYTVNGSTSIHFLMPFCDKRTIERQYILQIETSICPIDANVVLKRVIVLFLFVSVFVFHVTSFFYLSRHIMLHPKQQNIHFLHFHLHRHHPVSCFVIRKKSQKIGHLSLFLMNFDDCVCNFCVAGACWGKIPYQVHKRNLKRASDRQRYKLWSYDLIQTLTQNHPVDI